jgi:predicted enzyme related to lactoylglutathione lyase
MEAQMKQGQVSWCEVMGEDGGALQAFYADLFGWQFTPAPTMPAYGMVMPSDAACGPGVGVSAAPEGYEPGDVEGVRWHNDAWLAMLPPRGRGAS